jgi:hypothetical protein
MTTKKSLNPFTLVIKDSEIRTYDEFTKKKAIEKISIVAIVSDLVTTVMQLAINIARNNGNFTNLGAMIYVIRLIIQVLLLIKYGQG